MTHHFKRSTAIDYTTGSTSHDVERQLESYGRGCHSNLQDCLNLVEILEFTLCSENQTEAIVRCIDFELQNWVHFEMQNVSNK